ncbi:pantoate--beta-alanine ligase [Nocardioides sp. CFH 31398]|uniref:pantoate--beta-alanine ligase n=1 Tax=Nocardioides sp. CFH 31398 TaxID=2919579 RepID=UPI001F05EDCD|nr:pantoate--beta-alanine ligase [Nocardioides sp. CFH 31398]MCH1866134.1 pantoate--beta-alanine ligase [Nocardioides sp. CFH 31398]
MSTTTATTTSGTRPVLVDTAAALAELLAPRRATGPVVLVPTMGALHDGHADLMDAARERAGEHGTVVVTVFVNPLQFGQGEDLDRYPRTLDADLETCAAHGVDAVLAPSVDEVYPGGRPQVTVHPGPLGDVLEGASRPGHFAGVLTVVAKLFGLVRPDVAVFGEKDYQQQTLVRRMALDLALGVDVLTVPTRREPDGLALSSRNRYLDADQRRSALALSAALRAAADAGARGADAARAAALAVLDAEPGVDLDYLALVAPDLGDAPTTGDARLLVAARVGTTRLIDTMPLTLDQTARDDTHDPTGQETA